MKRITKNIIMSIVLILCLIGMILTINYYSSSSNNNDASGQIQMGGTPPEMPSGENGSNMGTPPEKPEGNANSEFQNTPPEMPSNDNSNMRTPPEMSLENNTESSVLKYLLIGGISLLGSLDILYLILSKFNKRTLKETFSSSDKIVIYFLGTIILTGCLTFGGNYLSNNMISSNANQNMPGGGMNNGSVSYSSQKEITSDETITNGNYTSSSSDENVVLATGDIEVNVSNVTVTKTGDSDGGDSTSFYGTNSGVLAKSGANVTINNATIETNATGANGVFSYGGSATTSNSSSDGTTINISDSKITTTKDNSGGIMITGGGIMNAINLEINTAGTSSAAIRSDRGGGTVNVNGGTYKTIGQGSPTIYSTANITVKNATLEATASEGVVIEGKNSVVLDGCTLTDTNNKLNGQSTTYKNIFLYQSMSGDADTGTAEFTAKNSTITTNKGDTLYVTNTTASITLENNTIVNNDSTGSFLRIQKDSWGTSGSNGGDVTLSIINQKVNGDVVVDSISTLKMTMKDSSYYEGAINSDNTAKSIAIVLDKTSKIKLTSNSYVTSFENADSTNSNIDFNGYKLYVNGSSIN